MSRMPPEELKKITGCKRPKYQAAWFKQHMGVDVPCDRQGPVMTEAAYEALLAKRLGILPQSADGSTKQRPTVRLLKTA